MILGYKRHGKDTVAEILRDLYGFKFESSSMAAARLFIFDALKDKFGYRTVEECFNDRDNHRAEWHELIWRYNTPDATKLARGIYEHNDVYVGCRHDKELKAIKEAGLYKVSIWVDASGRLEPEAFDSCKVDKSMADFVIPNNGDLKELSMNTYSFMETYLVSHGYIHSSGESLEEH